MAKQTFTNDASGYAAANAVADPKHIWIDGNTIRVFTGSDIPAAPPVDSDLVSVQAYAKLKALRNMTPSQVSAWVDSNVTNLAQAQDAIKTLAIGVGYLIRQVI
jgi:hypothetical protein